MKKQHSFQPVGVIAHAQTKTMRQLLEETRLSRLKPFSLKSMPAPKSSPCSACGGRLEADNEFQQKVKLCRKCLAHYANVGSILDRHADEKARAVKINSFAEKLNF